MSDQPTPHLWIADSDYTGELNARLGVAAALGASYEILPLSSIDALVRTQAGGQANPPARREPDMVLSGTGEDTVDLFAELARIYPRPFCNVFLASILPDELNPRLREYDIIAAPPHPALSADSGTAQWITLLGVPHGITRDTLNDARRQWSEYYAGQPRPFIGALLGGHTRYCFGFTADYGQRLGGRLKQLAEAVDGYVTVTNSRRTPADALAALRRALGEREADFIDWKHPRANAYPALLAHADLLVATGDSLSMCCEAAYTGKPLYVALDEEATEIYHRQTVQRLFDQGCARPLTPRHTPWHYTPLDMTALVANAMREHWLRQRIATEPASGHAK